MPEIVPESHVIDMGAIIGYAGLTINLFCAVLPKYG
jgi:hypothetical protein